MSSEWIISTEDIDDITGGGFTVGQKLVRCKDCKHYFFDGDRWLCTLLSNYYEPVIDLDDDGFCSRGERRSE